MRIRDIEGVITRNMPIRIWFNQETGVNWHGNFWEMPECYKDELDIEYITAITPRSLDDQAFVDIFVKQNTDEVPLLPRLSELRDYSGCSEALKMKEVAE